MKNTFTLRTALLLTSLAALRSIGFCTLTPILLTPIPAPAKRIRPQGVLRTVGQKLLPTEKAFVVSGKAYFTARCDAC
jgi:hypothetical protein